MNKADNIAKNTSYLTIALILQKIISFSYFALLARAFGPALLGKYYLVLSLTSIFAIIIDLGFVNFLTREVAQNQEEARKLLGHVTAIKIPLTVLTILAMLVFAKICSYDLLTIQLLSIAGVCLILDSFTNSFFSVVRGFHNLKYESIAAIIFQLIVLLFGGLALFFHLGVLAAMFALALASVYSFVFSWWALHYRLGVRLHLFWDKETIQKIFLVSWPFAAFVIFQRVYTYIDSVMLSLLAGDYQVGLYQIAFKIVFALQFLPNAFAASLYPAMSAYWQGSREKLSLTFEHSLNYLTIISWPIVVGAIVLADRLVLIFKADYATAALPLQISMVALFFIFINFAISALLNACDRQKKNTFNMGVITVASIVLNFILIPHFQAVGASITVLLTNFLMTVLSLREARKIIPYHFRNNLIVLMGLAVWSLERFVPLVISVSAGVLLYFIFLYLLGGFKKEDITKIYSSFRHKNHESFTGNN